MMLFEVMTVIWNLNRVGVSPTANICSKKLGISEYQVRKATTICAAIDLVNWKTLHHRPNVVKRSYYLTDKGRAVLMAFHGFPLSFKGVIG